MRIVCTSDTHFPFDPEQIPQGDLLLHGGDLMLEGTPMEWAPRLRSLRALQWFKRRIFVPGNHDMHAELYAGPVGAELRNAGVKMLDDRYPRTEWQGLKILGIPFVVNLPGWAYNRDETWIYDWLKAATDGFEPDIVVSHAPMWGHLDIINPEQTHFEFDHVGSHALRKWFDEPGRKIKLWVNGHIHESYGQKVHESGTILVNACMCDRQYNQTNPPIVVDL